MRREEADTGLAESLSEDVAAIDTTILGRNRRVSKRPRRRSIGEVVSRCTTAMSKNVPAGMPRSVRCPCTPDRPCRANTSLATPEAHPVGPSLHEGYMPADCTRKNLLLISSIVVRQHLGQPRPDHSGKEALRTRVRANAVWRRRPWPWLRRGWGGCRSGRPMVRPVQHEWRIW